MGGPSFFRQWSETEGKLEGQGQGLGRRCRPSAAAPRHMLALAAAGRDATARTAAARGLM